MTPNWPMPARTASNSSRFCAVEHRTISPAPVTTSSSRQLSACVPNRQDGRGEGGGGRALAQGAPLDAALAHHRRALVIQPLDLVERRHIKDDLVRKRLARLGMARAARRDRQLVLCGEFEQARDVFG